jgi:hypothetical protein
MGSTANTNGIGGHEGNQDHVSRPRFPAALGSVKTPDSRGGKPILVADETAEWVDFVLAHDQLMEQVKGFVNQVRFRESHDSDFPGKVEL